MSHVEQGGGKGRKTTEELNLVPFIDLMSVLITFLLIAAVWNQVNMMQIGSSIYGKNTFTEKDPPPEIKQSQRIVLKLDVKTTGYVLNLEADIVHIPLLSAGRYDVQRLRAYLTQFKKRFPDKEDAVMAVADEVKYEELIHAMDALLSEKFPQISISTGGPA